MAHLLSFIDTRPQFEIANPPAPPNPLAPPSPPSKGIKTSPRKALLVENDPSLLNLWTRVLTEEGYDIHHALNCEEGLRLYRDCAPFNVVLINYCVPQSNERKTDYWAPQTNGTAIALDILKTNRSQGIIIAAFDYRNAGDVKLEEELKHIPLLVDTSNSQLRRVLEKIEVDRAMETLTPSELLRLQRFADYRVQGLGRAARGRTGKDLLNEAQLRTLIGAGATRQGRHWNKHVDFVWHLTGAMRSISSGWKRQFKDKEPCLMSETLTHDAEGHEHSPLDNKASDHATAEHLLIEKDEEDRILAMFKDDPKATQVLQGLLDGLKKNEIMSKYGLDEKEFAATVKRILKLLGRRNGGSKG